MKVKAVIRFRSKQIEHVISKIVIQNVVLLEQLFPFTITINVNIIIDY